MSWYFVCDSIFHEADFILASCSGEQCSQWVSCLYVISLFLINYIYAKLVSFITVFSKIGEKCQNYTDGFANGKGMNYFFMSLYAKFIRELQKVCHHFYTYLGKDVEYYEFEY